MRPVLSAEAQRAFDRYHGERGVPGLVLMENAGRGAAHLIGLKLRPRPSGQAPRTGSSVVGSCIRCADERALEGSQVVVVCGPGNNGGDGYVVARHLKNRGTAVLVLSVVELEQLAGDAASMAEAWVAVGGEVRVVRDASSDSGADGKLPMDEVVGELGRAQLIVDALLGTGLSRSVEGTVGALIDAINDSGRPVIALDVPSGLDATSGRVWGRAIVAFHTVTFAHLKTGLLTTAGHAYGGHLTVSHIGVPATLPEACDVGAWLVESEDVAERLPPRQATDHKGKSGRVAVVAGTPGTLGAARLCCRGALRAGAGLVTLWNRREVVERFDGEAVEVMTRERSGSQEKDRSFLTSQDALVVGPGLGLDDTAVEMVRAVLSARRPTVVDADALSLLAKGQVPLSDLHELCVLTPHPGEAARLLGTSAAEIEESRWQSAKRLAERTGTIVLLKGSRTIIQAPGQIPFVSAFGTAALGTGGSGDTLCGLLAAFCVGVDSLEALLDRTIAAVGVQGLAAEAWSAENGDRGLLASEVADGAPRIMSGLLAERSSESSSVSRR